MEALLGNLELILVEAAACRHGEPGEEERLDVLCPAIVEPVTDMHGVMVNALIKGGVSTKEQPRAAFNALQWMADIWKTNADTEERGLQEKVTRIFRGLRR